MGIDRTARAAGLALGTAEVVAGGFLVSPPIRRPARIAPAVTSEKVELSEGLPEGFVRYARAAFGDPIPGFQTAVIWGRAAWHPDRATGLPGSAEAPGDRSIGGPKIAWRAELEPWRRFGAVRRWSEAAAIWEDHDDRGSGGRSTA